MSHGPNLARQPFLNRRPVIRVTALLALAAVGLLCVNVWLYWRHFAGQGEQRTELEELTAKSAAERATLEEALTAVERFDIDWQQDQITFLNAKIAERTFSWSALFDHLAEVLPRTVRIERVTPNVIAREDRRRRGDLRSAADEVALQITGAAEEDEALLELVDAFFAHGRFRRPSLKVEARDGKSKQVGYSMSVVYMPTPPTAEEAAPVAPGDPAPEGPTPEGPTPGDQPPGGRTAQNPPPADAARAVTEGGSTEPAATAQAVETEAAS